MKVTRTRTRDGRNQYSTHERMSWLFPGDIHLPFQNDKAVDACLASYDSKPGKKGLFLGGDFLDMYWVSSWPKGKDLSKLGGYTKTRDSILDFVSKVSGRFDEVILGAGNHEARVERLSKQYPGFDGKWYWMFKDILPTNWHYLDHGFRFVLPQKSVSNLPIVMEHGDRALHVGVPSATSLLSAYPNQSTIIGHNHRVQQALKTTWCKGKPQLAAAYSAGHLSSLKLNDWINNPDWQLGWVDIDISGVITTHTYFEGRVS